MTTSGHGDRPTETTGFVYFATLVIALGGSLFGYNATVIAGAILFIEKQFPMSPLLEESVIAASLVGALVGAAVGGPLADRFGRRWVLLLTAAVFLFGALGSALAPNVPALAAGRALVGSAIGIVSVVGTLYLAEISPDHVRGRLISIYMAANMGGVICGYLVELALDAEGSWRWMLGFPVVIAVPFALGVWALPETPRWCVCNDRLGPAKTALRRIRRGTDVERELEHIQASVGGRKGSWSDLLGAALRPALVLGIGLGVLQRVTGINIPFFYGPTIFEFAGMQSVRMDILAGLGVGTALLVGQLLSLIVVDHLGRRPLLLIGYGGMVCGLFPLGLAFALGDQSQLGQWMAVGGVMLVAAAWAAGPASVTFLLISELYPQQVRGPAMSVATVAIWSSFLVMTFTFLTTLNWLGESATFWAYGLLSLVAMGLVYLRVPETKGKDLEEISRSLAGGK